MSARQSARRLVRLYPRAWRERYGDELAALISESSSGRRIPWRTRADVVRSAAREHARRLAPAAGPAQERSRTGVLLALWAWVLFACAGAVVQKTSEHWQASVPGSGRALPSAAFGALVAAAVAGAAVVLAGLAVVLPPATRFVRSGRVHELRGPLVRSAAATLAASAAGTAIVIWAHRLTAAQRSGHDGAYAVGFAAFALLAALCLATWGAAAAVLLRRLELSPRTLRAEAALACALAGAMLAATAATALWWGSAASAARAFPSTGGADGRADPATVAMLATAVAAMLVATLAAATGARIAVVASRGLPPAPEDGARA